MLCCSTIAIGKLLCIHMHIPTHVCMFVAGCNSKLFSACYTRTRLLYDLFIYLLICEMFKLLSEFRLQL